MMYSEKLVVVVTQDGKILREHEPGTVRLPFGADYGLQLKNLECRRAVVGIDIDGEDVLCGQRVVLEPGATANLEGFMDAGGSVQRRFRFIQKTKEVVEHRGDRLDDGTIRVEFRFEAPPPEVVKRTVVEEYIPRPYYWPDYYYPQWPNPYRWPEWPSGPFWVECPKVGATWTQKDNDITGDVLGDIGYVGSGTVSCSLTNQCQTTYNTGPHVPLPDEGITVKGAETQQQFHGVCVGELEKTSHTLILRLVGYQPDGRVVENAVTTRVKLQCPSCGRKRPSAAKFCDSCGTALT